MKKKPSSSGSTPVSNRREHRKRRKKKKRDERPVTVGKPQRRREQIEFFKLRDPLERNAAAAWRRWMTEE